MKVIYFHTNCSMMIAIIFHFVCSPDIIQRLDASKYQRLNNDVSIQDVNRFTVADLDGIMILCKARMLMTFPQFAEVNYSELKYRLLVF